MQSRRSHSWPRLALAVCSETAPSATIAPTPHPSARGDSSSTAPSRANPHPETHPETNRSTDFEAGLDRRPGTRTHRHSGQRTDSYCNRRAHTHGHSDASTNPNGDVHPGTGVHRHGNAYRHDTPPPATATPTATPLPPAATTPTATTPAPPATNTPTPTPAQPSGLWRGITVAPEDRCSDYDSDDYHYSPSVEPRIVNAQGGIYGPYTGTWFDSIKETDIEHIVARSEAHDSGLCAVDPETKDEFASDLLNLTLASPSVNRHQKVAKDAAEWLPDLNQCWYVDRIIRVQLEYDLTIDRTEADAIDTVLATCNSKDMVVLEQGGSTSATATPTPTPTAAPEPTADTDVDAL